MAVGYSYTEAIDPAAPISPQAIERKRRMAELLLKQGMDDKPIQSWTQGAANVAQSLLGAYQMKDTDTSEAAARKASIEQFERNIRGFGGGDNFAPSASAPQSNPSAGGMADAAPVQAGSPDLSKMAEAIASIESRGSGDYAALGPVTRTGDRAYGKYQVMGANIPQWTEAALGQRLTPEQFAQSPEAQDAVFKHRFGQYVQQTGNPADAASMWFTGKPLAQGAGKADQLGTTGQAYADKFMRAYAGPQGAQTPAQAAIGQASPQGAPMPLQGAQGGIPAPQATPNIVRALASIASDPWLSDSQKSIAMMLAKDQLAKSNPEYGFQVVGDQLYRTDKRSGNAIPMGVSANKTALQVIGQDEYGNNMYGFVNPTTQQITPVAPPGTAAAQMQNRGQAAPPQAAPSPDGQPPAQAAPPADGIPPPPPGINPKIWRDEKTRELARGEKFTESQGKALTFGNRMENAESILSNLENEGTSRTNRYGANIPLFGNSVITEGYQKFQQAEREFINALLRRESGAVIADSEYNNFSKQYFPQPGDSPDVIAQKRQSRKVAIDAMKKEAGPNYKSPTPAATNDGWREVAPGVRIREKN